MMDHAPLPEDGPFHPIKDDCFRFACHPGVPCFNECCADLNLALTPYDILRLKNRLGMTSDQFLEKHAETHTDDGGRFPRVQLKMTEKPGRPCPFVTQQGCSVYEDRPGACRIYPVGRGSAHGGKEIFFLVREKHCRGFEEPKEWAVKDWLGDQGLKKYNRMNDLWMEIITSKKSLGPAEHMVRKIQMFYMVSYNLDKFRAFVSGSRFLDMFDLDAELVKKIPQDDETLLELGFDWLHFSLYGEKTLPLKNGG